MEARRLRRGVTGDVYITLLIIRLNGSKLGKELAGLVEESDWQPASPILDCFLQCWSLFLRFVVEVELPNSDFVSPEVYVAGFPRAYGPLRYRSVSVAVLGEARLTIRKELNPSGDHNLRRTELLRRPQMRSHIPQVGTSPASLAGWASLKRVFPVILLGILLNVATLPAQQVDRGATVDKQTIDLLLRKIEQLEAAHKQLQDRVTQLEKAQGELAQNSRIESPALAKDSAAQSPAHFATRSETLAGAQGEEAAPDRIEENKTLLSIRGFGDYSFHGQNQKGTSTSFSLGQADLFITSNISDRFRFVTDLVFEKGRGNQFEEDLERVLLEYRHSDYFRLELGRFHTAIGYYNLAFRHSSWWQTATGRPYLFLFEDEGGILPGHNVGASASGEIPSGELGLHYIAEVGNGRSPLPRFQSVQNFVDDNHHKSFDLNVFARPDAIPGLQAGFSVYRDVLAPPNSVRVGETILDTYAVLTRSKFEWLNEALLIRHSPQGLPRVWNTPGFYTQVSQGFGPFRPYFRYQYVNAPDNEPVFLPLYQISVGLQHGPSLGLRYDFNESVAAKLQYDHTDLRRVQGISQPSISQLALQLTFAF